MHSHANVLTMANYDFLHHSLGTVSRTLTTDNRIVMPYPASVFRPLYYFYERSQIYVHGHIAQGRNPTDALDGTIDRRLP